MQDNPSLNSFRTSYFIVPGVEDSQVELFAVEKAKDGSYLCSEILFVHFWSKPIQEYDVFANVNGYVDQEESVASLEEAIAWIEARERKMRANGCYKVEEFRGAGLTHIADLKEALCQKQPAAGKRANTPKV